jgi:hypothetical protein
MVPRRPVLDHVAGALHGRGLADDAEIGHLAALAQGFADHHGAIHRGSFFIAGEQEGDVQRGLGLRGEEFLGGHHHRGQRGLHVAGAAPEKRPLAVRGGERVTVPLGQRSGRDDIGMTGKRYGPGSADDHLTLG